MLKMVKMQRFSYQDGEGPVSLDCLLGEPLISSVLELQNHISVRYVVSDDVVI